MEMRIINRPDRRGGLWLPFLLLITLSGSLFLTACSNPAKAFTKHSQRAKNYIEEKKFEEARIELMNSLKLRPEDTESILNLARVQVRLGAFSQAAGAYRAYLKQRPDDRDVAVEYARLVFAGKAFKEVKRVLTGINNDNPDDLDVLILLSGSLAHLGETEDSLSLAERATNVAPGESRAWLNLAQIRIMMKDLSGAGKAIGKAEDIAPGTGQLLLMKVNLKMAQRQPDEAVSIFRDLISQHPDNRSYRFRFAELLEGLQRNTEAKEVYSKLIAKKDEPELENRLGLVLVRLKDDDGALASWTKAIELRENYIAPRLNLARLYMRRGEKGKALDTVQEILKSDSKNPEGLALRGSIYLNDRKFGEAAADLQNALEAYPENSEWRFSLARAQLGSGDRQTTRQTLQTILEKSPSYTPARLALARLESSLGSLAESSKQAMMLSRDSTFGKDAMLVLGDNAMRAKNPVQAEAIYRRTEELFKPDPKTDYRLAGSLMGQGKKEEAVEVYRTLLKDNPGNLPAIASLTRALLSMDRVDEALKIAKEQAGSGKPALRYFYGVTLERTGHPDEAESVYRDILDKEPGFSLVYSSLAQLLARQGKLADAEDWLKKAIAEKPDAAGFHVLLGMVYDLNGDKTGAVSSYRNALKLKSDFTPALNNLAWDLSERGDLDEALRLATHALEKSPEDPLVMDTYGWILYRKGETVSAAGELNKAVEAMPNHPEIQEHLAEVLEKLGRTTEAAEHRAKAAKLRGE